MNKTNCWKKFGIALVLSLLLLVYFLPQIVSQPYCTQFLLSIFNRFIAGKVQVKELSCNWTQGFTLEGVELFDPEQRKVASIETFSWRAPLLTIFLEPGVTGSIDFAASAIDLIGEKERGSFSIERLISSIPTHPSQNQSNDTIHFFDVFCKSTFHNVKEAALELRCQIETESSQKKRGNVDIHLQSSPENITVQGDVSSFPTEALVTLLEVFSREVASEVSPLFGEIPQSLSLHLSGSGTLEAYDLLLQIDPVTLYAGKGIGTFDLRRMQIRTKVLPEHPNVFSLDLAMGVNSKESIVYDIFGEELAFTCSLPITFTNGDITLNKAQAHLKSQKFASLDIALSCLVKENILLLQEPLKGSFTTVEAKNPVTLTIDPEGFSIPLSPFSLETMAIQSLTIEPGVQKLKNGKLLSFLISFLKISLSASHEVSVWFTPLYLNVEKGVAHVKRADFLLADRFPLAIWGQINLANTQLALTLGISPDTLSRAFLIITLDKTSFIQIPVHGQIGNPIFDTGRATAKIAALRLQQTWSPQTAILGTLLNVASSIGKDEPPTPPPTTSPFPWDKPESKSTR